MNKQLIEQSYEIAKARYAEALDTNKIKAKKAVAVIGAGVAGMKAAISLAEKETDVVLIEKEPFVGGRVAQWDSLSTTSETGKEMVKRLYNELIKLENVTKMTNSEVVENKGSVGNIMLKVRTKTENDSEGLILLTSDGDIVNKILRARNNHEKEYIVRVDKPITPKFLEKMRNGVPILDTVTKKCEVEQIDTLQFRIVLTQGLNRQIRRMCEYLGYEVKKLKRIRIMNIKLDLPIGKWRDLTDAEMKELAQLLQDSSKTVD
jgi:pseudouridine synthase